MKFIYIVLQEDEFVAAFKTKRGARRAIHSQPGTWREVELSDSESRFLDMSGTSTVADFSIIKARVKE